jgi:uncharacterized protein involved in exopolysaccharide biosynthesis
VEQRPAFTFREALLHRWYLVLAIAALFVLAAGALSLRPRTYEATAVIYLDIARTASDFDAGISAGDLLQHDWIVLSGSRPVLQAACASPGVTCSPAELASPETTLAKRVRVAVSRGTSMLGVTAKGRVPQDAAALANGVAQAMIDQDKSEVQRLLKPSRDDLEKQLTELAAMMDAEQQALQRSTPGSSIATAHQAQLTRLQGQYATTFARREDLIQRQDRLTNIATIVQPAMPPARPQAPSPSRYLLAGLAAGLVVGLLAGLLAERFDTRLYTTESLAAAAGVPVALLASPPRGSAPPNGAYSVALASLLARAPDTRTVLVTGASSRDHSDPVAVGLGTVAAHAGRQVVVVQGDGLGAKPRPQGNGEVSGMKTISVAGDDGAETAALVAAVRKRADAERTPGAFMLVSVPSPDSSPAALMLSGTTNRAIVVATKGATRFEDARRTADLLRQCGVEVVAGILLTRQPASPRR